MRGADRGLRAAQLAFERRACGVESRPEGALLVRVRQQIAGKARRRLGGRGRAQQRREVLGRCRPHEADWAAQRPAGLELVGAVDEALPASGHERRLVPTEVVTDQEHQLPGRRIGGRLSPGQGGECLGAAQHLLVAHRGVRTPTLEIEALGRRVVRVQHVRRHPTPAQRARAPFPPELEPVRLAPSPLQLVVYAVDHHVRHPHAAEQRRAGC